MAGGGEPVRRDGASQRNPIRAADRAILQSWLQHLNFRWGLIVHFGNTQIEFHWVYSEHSWGNLGIRAPA